MKSAQKLVSVCGAVHVLLHRSPEGPDVARSKASGSLPMDQLKEEGVPLKDGPGEDLHQVSNGKERGEMTE